LQRALEGALEVAQRLRSGLADAGVAVAACRDVLLPLRLDARQGQFFTEDFRQLLQRQLDFEDVAARLVACTAFIVALGRAERLADLAVTLSGAGGAFAAIAELRNLDLRQGDADQVASLFADHLATGDVLAQVALHLAADELAEALVVAFDLLSHGEPPGVRSQGSGVRRPPSLTPDPRELYFLACPRAKMLATKVSTSVAHTSQ